VTERALVVNFLGNTAGLEAALKRASTQLNGFQTAGAGMQSLGQSMTRNLTVPILAVGGAAVKMAVDFQSSTERLRTQAGATQHQVDLLRQGMLRMSGSLGTTPEQLSTGMYHVVSSMNAVLAPTQRVSGELQILKYSAELAKVGGSDLEETSYALASAMNALHAPISQTGKVAAQLNAIVGAGDMTMNDLIEAFKSGIVPGAHEAGLSLQSLGAAMAVMGDMGMRGSLAGTRLRMSIALLSSPSAAAAKVLDTLGLTAKQATSTSDAMSIALEKAGLRTTQLGADLKKPDGLAVALKDLNDHLRESGLTATGAAAVMNKAFGGGRMGATITLLAQNTDRLGIKFAQIGTTTGQFGADWTATTETASFKWHQMISTVEADGIRLGNTILPTVLKIGDDVVKDVDKIAHAFTSLPKGAQDAIITGGLVLAGIGPAMKLLGVFTGGVGKLWQISERLNAWGAGSADSTLSSGAARQAMSSVGTMTVGTLIAKTSVGSVGASGYPLGGPTSTTTRPYTLPATLPAAIPATVPAAETAAIETSMSTSLIASVRSGLGTALGHGLQGAMIAGVGSMVSTAVGAAIHGAVGKAISTVGTDASIGAGLGRIFGPEGTIPGALAGALVGGITTFINQDAEAQGKKWADKFTASLPGKLTTATQDALAKGAAAAPPPAANTAANARFQTSAQHSEAADSRFNFGWKLGKQAGDAFTQSMGAVIHQSLPALMGSMETALHDVPKNVQAAGAPAVQAWRDEAARQMLAYAAGLAKNGKLPQHAVESMIKAMESQFPGLKAYLQSSGEGSAHAIAQSMALADAQKNLRGALDEFRKQWNFSWQLAKSTNDNILSNTTTAMGDLKGIIAHGTHDQRLAAEAEYKLLRDHAQDVWKQMAADAQHGLAHAASVATAALSKVTSLFHPAAPPAARKGHEQGGLVQFGRAGDRGRDTIPVEFGGVSIRVGSGEVGAVLTADQQAFLNERTQDVGGLQGVFSTFTRPHYMASGGLMGLRQPGKPSNDQMAALELLHRVWNAARSDLPGARGFPVTTFSNTAGLFETAADPNGQREGRSVLIPNWAADLMIGKNVSKIWPGVGKRDARNSMLQGILHEWAHYLQAPSVLNAVGWESEGGAEAWTVQFANAIMAKAGITGFSMPGLGSNTFGAWVKKVRSDLGEGWVDVGQFTGRMPDGTPIPKPGAAGPNAPYGTFATGGTLPFAGTFHNGGVIPGPLGREAIARVRGGEVITPAFATGGMVWGTNPTTGKRVKHSKEEWQDIWATYHHNHPTTSTTTTAAAAAASAQAGKLPAGLAQIPSQSTTGQIRMAQLQNALQVAQNTNSTGGQKKALTGEVALERAWLAEDKKRLAQINRALDGHPSRTQRSTLSQDKLAMLQEIGAIEGNIGSASSSLLNIATGGSSGTGTSASTSQFDLAPAGGGVKLPTAYDVSRVDRPPAHQGLYGQPAGPARVVASGAGAAHSGGAPAHVVNNTPITVYVAHEGDVPKVADAIDRATGSRLHARLRSTGLRGT
jgi:TP901 family phage tail tape measure protein